MGTDSWGKQNEGISPDTRRINHFLTELHQYLECGIIVQANRLKETQELQRKYVQRRAKQEKQY